ncbi:MAG: type II toxin-antitoxin system MqsA family antitoxin [Candidatus Schekmanbacteria bacterium]|nr:type II toxin-antitoxin system MqsA family antitoxin [Candidatus Schekmanbacteria bacterium]
MKCVICRTGEIAAGEATFVAEREGHTFVLRHVPARACGQCGEPYFGEAETARVLQQIEQAARSGADVAVLEYQAA